MADDWTSEETIGSPARLKIAFIDPAGNPQVATLISTGWSRVTTSYKTLAYRDSEGKYQTQDVAVSRKSVTRSTAAAVNGAYVKWRLERGEGLPSGDANKEADTQYSYVVTTQGPKLVYETTEELISQFELAGSLNIGDYTGFEPTSELVKSSRTEVYYAEATGANGRPFTKTSTSRYVAYGLTQEGSQSASKSLAEDPGDGSVTREVFEVMSDLVFDGTEVRNSVGRIPTPGRPSGTSFAADNLLNPRDPEDGPGSTLSGDASYSGSGFTTTQFDFGGDERDFSYYSLPFTPDRYGSLLNQAAAEQAAREYAICLNALRAGYAYGFNITTSADRLPSLPLAPLFVNAAGISVAMRTNGTSWAFDASGLVASSDLLLCGVAGTLGPVTSSWVRLPVPTSGLPVLSEPTTTTSPAPASTMPAPDGFDPLEPAGVFDDLPADNNDQPAATQTVTKVVEPYLLVEPLVARSRHRYRVTEFAYALTDEVEVELRSRHLTTIQAVVLILVPALEAEAEILAPVVSTGGVVTVPPLEVEAEAGAVLAGGGAAVAVPALEVEAEALAPIAPRLALLVEIPGLEVEAEALAPVVAIGAAALVPELEVEAEAAAPRAGGNLGDWFGLSGLIEDDLLELF